MKRIFLIHFWIGISLVCGGMAQAGTLDIGGRYSLLAYNYDDHNNQRTENGSASISYYFLSSSALEMEYSLQKVTLNYADYILVGGQLQQRYGNIAQTYTNLSVNLIQNLLEENSRIQPFVKIGLGWVMYHKSQTDTNVTTGETFSVSTADMGTNLLFPVPPTISGNIGGGFRIGITNFMSLDLSGSVFWTNLDSKDARMNYNWGAGVRFRF